MVEETLIMATRGAVLELQLHRPDARNALNPTILEALEEAARKIRRSSARAVILCGGDDFSVGAELGSPQWTPEGEGALLAAREVHGWGAAACRALAEIEVPTVCAIEGACIGGGLALAAACDFRVSSASAVFALPEVPLGIPLGWGAVPRLVGLVGPARAKRLVLLGHRPQPATLEEWGLVDEVCEPGQALVRARKWAEEAAALPPVAAQMAKSAIDAAASALAAATSHADRDQLLLAIGSDDFAEGVQAFRERRRAKFSGD